MDKQKGQVRADAFGKMTTIFLEHNP